MADISKITIINETYDIKDTTARNDISRINENISAINENINNIKNLFKINSMTDLIASEIVQNGDYVQTLGYFNSYDGGAGLYKISNENLVEDLGKIIELNSGLFAILIEKNPTAKQYGIFSTNIDNKTRLQNYINNNNVIFLPNEQLNVLGNLVINQNCTIYSNNCELMFTNNTAETIEYALLFGNNNAELLASNVSITQKPNSLNINNSLQNNDILKIASSELWNTLRADYNKGELVEILSRTNSNITLYNNIIDNYTNASIFKLDTKKITIIGNLKINCLNSSYNNAVAFCNLKNSKIEKIESYLYGENKTSCLIDHCFNCQFDFIKSKQESSVTGGTDYGISVSSSQYIVILNAYSYGNRHGLTLSNFVRNGFSVVNRFHKINGNFFSVNNSCIGLHGSTDNCELSGNFYNAITLGGQNIKVRGNIENYTNNFCVYFGEIKSPNFDISNCIIHNHKLTESFQLLNFANYDIHENGFCNFDNNKIYNDSSQNIYVLGLQPSSNYLGISFQNNYIDFDISSYFGTIRYFADKSVDFINLGGSVSNLYNFNYPALITKTINQNYS